MPRQTRPCFGSVWLHDTARPGPDAGPKSRKLRTLNILNQGETTIKFLGDSASILNMKRPKSVNNVSDEQVYD
jgi:hypothetical protein